MYILDCKNKAQVKAGFPKSITERLSTHKVFTKDQCFYLNYHKFSIKSYVLDVGEAILIHIQNI